MSILEPYNSKELMDEYKEAGLEFRHHDTQISAANRLMLPPLVIGLLVLYGEVDKFLGVEFKNPEAAHLLIWSGCLIISLIWVFNVSRTAQLVHSHLDTRRKNAEIFGLRGHTKIFIMDRDSGFSKIFRHNKLRLVGFGIYFALLLNFLLRSMVFNGVPSPLESIIFHEVFVPWVAIINSVVLSFLIWFFYFKKPFSLSSKISKKRQRIAYISILLVLLVLLILDMVFWFWAVIEVSAMGLLFTICYLCFERQPASSSKISKKWQYIAYISILLVLLVVLLVLLNPVLINLQQEQPNINDCLVRGLKYFAKGNYEFAIEDFNIAIALDSNNAGAYFNRGSAYYKKREHANAIVDFDKAIMLDPQNQRARDLRNKAQRELENLAKQ